MKRIDGFTRGINLGGWLSQCVSMEKEHFDTFISEDDIKEIASWGLDHVRLPIDYFIIEEEDGTIKEDGFVYIDNCIKWCENSGINIILDLHRTFGYTFDPLVKEDKEVFFFRKDLQDRFVQTWCEIARRYKDKHNMVAYELLNEIVSMNVVDEWNEVIKRVVPAIREIAPDNYIIFGGVCYNSVSSIPLLVKPMADKLIYTFHCYEPLVFTHQKAYWVENMSEDFEISYPAPMDTYIAESKKLSYEHARAIFDTGVDTMDAGFFESIFEPALKFAEENDVPLYCGEYGVIDRAPLNDTVRWLSDINSVFKKYNIGRALWTYKNKDFGIVDEHYKDIKDEMVKLL